MKTHAYYDENNKEETFELLEERIQESMKLASRLVVPTIKEKLAVMDVLKEFVKAKKRIVYGGTALNEFIKKVNPDDAIYNDYNFKDFEFYSTSPAKDTIELCDILYKKGFKYINGKEAQHEGTFTIHVNYQTYCDITWMPHRVFHKVKKEIIKDIAYVHPEFAFIDHLRMFTDPLNMADFRWKKQLKRTMTMLKYYPMNIFSGIPDTPEPSELINELIQKIKKEFLSMDKNETRYLISGYMCYNLFINQSERMLKQNIIHSKKYGTVELKKIKTNVPYLELFSTKYTDFVIDLFEYLTTIVPDPSKLSKEETFPLFQFTKYTIMIKYNNMNLVRVIQKDGLCLPIITSSNKQIYCTYQTLLMDLLVKKFEAYIVSDDNTKSIYMNYGRIVSNLITCRNIFLEKMNLNPINNTFFSEFSVNCVGETESFFRESMLRMAENISKGRIKLSYFPSKYFEKMSEDKEPPQYDVKKFSFPNISGNTIMKDKSFIFIIKDGKLVLNETHIEDEEETNLEQSDQ